MAIAQLIKTANTPLKTVGDIQGIYRNAHQFSSHELNVYDHATIRGTRQVVVTKLRGLRIPKDRAFRTSTTLWSLTEPEIKHVWQDTDNKWYFLEVRPAFSWSFALLTQAEKDILANNIGGPARDAAYEKLIVNPGVWRPINQVEAVDLN